MANIRDLLGDSYREDMTNDEIVEALKDVKLPKDESDERSRLKVAFDKASSEAADYKRQLKARMSEEEKRVAEETEKMQKIEAENAELKKKIAISDYTSKFLASGLDVETASKTAEAAYTGDIDTVIANYNARIARAKEDAKAELIASTPNLQGKGGSGSQGIKDYSASISGSLADGDFATAAALMRVAQEQNNND